MVTFSPSLRNPLSLLNSSAGTDCNNVINSPWDFFTARTSWRKLFNLSVRLLAPYRRVRRSYCLFCYNVTGTPESP
jgi:hypothetical protein